MLCSPSSSPAEGPGTRHSLPFAAQEDGECRNVSLRRGNFPGIAAFPARFSETAFDPAAAEDSGALIEDGGLAGSDSALRLREIDLHIPLS